MDKLGRRELIGGASALAGVALLGFGTGALGKSTAKSAALPKITMYKDPNCGCCGKWGEAAKAAGFALATVHSSDMAAVKERLGVPDSLLSCHTSTVGGYVVEGHVPLPAVKRLLRSKPRIRGIAVAGMPIGSPGMEVPGRAADPLTVMAFNRDGKVMRFGG